MNAIYTWLKTIVIFMLFLTILSNLLGKSDFKKYVNVVTGLLLVLITMNPLLKLTSLESVFDNFFDSSTFRLQTTEIGNEMRSAEDQQKTIILKTYKEEIIQQIAQLLEAEHLYVVDAKVMIEEDSSSDDYAKIKYMDVKATYYVQEDEAESRINDVMIQDIRIDDISITDFADEPEEKKDKEEFLTPMEIHVKTILSDFYNLSSDNINISIQGG